MPPFRDLTRKDAHAFREHWQKRVDDGEIRINSSNRRIRHVSGLYTVVKAPYVQIAAAA